MKCSCTIAMLAALLVISSSALASKPETFWDWNAIRQDMELFEGAISHTVGYERMGAYVPGYGVVFMVESGKDLDAVQREVERVLTYVAPSICGCGRCEWKDCFDESSRKQPKSRGYQGTS